MFDQPRKKFSGEDTFNSRRRQSLTLESNPKGSLLQPEQLFALASPTIASNSKLFIPAAIPKSAKGFTMKLIKKYLKYSCSEMQILIKYATKYLTKECLKQLSTY